MIRLAVNLASRIAWINSTRRREENLQSDSTADVFVDFSRDQAWVWLRGREWSALVLAQEGVDCIRSYNEYRKEPHREMPPGMACWVFTDWNKHGYHEQLMLHVPNIDEIRRIRGAEIERRKVAPRVKRGDVTGKSRSI